MNRPFGNLTGLKHQQTRRLERLYRRKVPPRELVTPELARQLAEISREVRRQVGILVNRAGFVTHVIVGDAKGLLIPYLPRERGAKGRLKGLRLIHTHLDAGPLTQDDLMDLALLRLDAVAALAVTPQGLPGAVHLAHLLPQAEDGRNWALIEADHLSRLDLHFAHLVESLEEELAKNFDGVGSSGKERAILVGVSSKSRVEAEDSMAELTELAGSAGLEVAATVIQHRQKVDPRFLMGKGRLTELVIQALQLGSDLLVFDAELTPSQVRSITDFTELRVIDRTQLILDLFAQRARSREGKLQVEMAQVKYLLPRLRGRDDALSRLTGGIGGRGPGETKLEIDRRRLQERLHRLNRDLDRVRAERKVRREGRKRQQLPILSIIGYTNAGKSTLFNALTHASVLAEDRLFATLDPTSRRLRFPKEREVLITDTVGFIQDLPKNLLEAFKATLEELEEADLLIHVVDLSNPRFPEQMEAVEHLLGSLELMDKPVLHVFNKMDLVTPELAALQVRIHHGVAISALDTATLPPLISRLEDKVEELAALPQEELPALPQASEGMGVD
uniref:GTPase HflX n=1 Tax=Desulfobacca acetoxidans TaxID=60893 RepID=A0A7V6DQ04_9BACT